MPSTLGKVAIAGGVIGLGVVALDLATHGQLFAGLPGTTTPTTGTPCTPQSIATWAQGIGLPLWVGTLYCQQHGNVLPSSLSDLVNWGNTQGYRNPSNGVWTPPTGVG